MFTNSDFAKLAQNKKKAAEAKAAASTTVTAKAKNMAQAVKEAAASITPTSHKALDDRTSQLLMLYAGLEQRMETVERVTQSETIIDADKAAVRAGNLLERMKAAVANEKKAEPKKEEVTPTVPVETIVQSEPVVEKPKKTKGIRFNDVPKMQ